MPGALDRLYTTHRNGMMQPTLNNLVKALKEMILEVFCSVYIIIDALDESSERVPLLNLIDEITGWNLDCLHILFTSRKEEELNRHLGRISVEVNLESSVVDADIAFHVHAVLQNDLAFSKWPEAQKLYIETSLTKGAHGM